jgi:hypothetical protein
VGGEEKKRKEKENRIKEEKRRDERKIYREMSGKDRRSCAASAPNKRNVK